MSVLWWIFAASYIGHIVPLLFLLTLRLSRNKRLIVQTVLSIAAVYVSIEMSILLLIFTYVHAFIRTLDWTDRYAVASVIFLLVDWLSPPATQSLYMVLFPLVFLVWQRNLYFRRDYKRIFVTLGAGLGIGLALSLVIRVIKELLFGNIVSWITPFFLWIGGWFAGIELDPTDRVNRFIIPENPNLDEETAVQETFFESASNQNMLMFFLFAGAILLAILLFFYLRRKQEIHEALVIPKQATETVSQEKRIVRTASQVYLLELGRRLERERPRRQEETFRDWLNRIDFVEGEQYATWLEAAEYGAKEAPSSVTSSFEAEINRLTK